VILLTLFICLMAFSMPAESGSAAEQSEAVSDLKMQILDLVFKVEDLAGAVQDLQIKETDTEIRIELAADVLFDFDKPKSGLTPTTR
jgi:hypothetical protein